MSLALLFHWLLLLRVPYDEHRVITVVAFRYWILTICICTHFILLNYL